MPPTSAGSGPDLQWLEFERSTRMTLRRLAAVLAPADDQTDLLQDTLLQCWRARKTFDPERGSFSTWAGTVMRNRATSRTANRVTSVSLAEYDRPDSAGRAPDLALLMDLRLRVNALPPRQREVVVLHHYAGYPLADVATMLVITVGSVKSTLHDARRSLAKGLSA